MSTSILDFPTELLEEILLRCDPVDVAQASMTCRKLHGVVYGHLDSATYSPGSTPEEDGKGRKKRRKTFWRELYSNQPLDDLRKCVNWIGIPRVPSSSSTSTSATAASSDDIDWEKELQRFIRARTVLSRPSRIRNEKEYRKVLRTLLRLVEWVPMATPSDASEGMEDENKGEGGNDLARNLVWVPVTLKEFLDDMEGGAARTFMTPRTSPSRRNSSSQGQDDDSDEEERTIKDRPSHFFRPLKKKEWHRETKQLHAHLHVLYGLTRTDLTKKKRVESRAWVYDMRNYNPYTEYGPLRLRPDRSQEGNQGEPKLYVDWEFMEKIHHVMSMHVVWEHVKDLIEDEVYEHEWDECEDKNGNRIRQRTNRERADFNYMIYPLSMPFTQVCGKCLWENNMSEGGGIPLVDVPEDGVIEGGALPENADWASIEGNWFVCFCFCDHRELIGAPTAPSFTSTSVYLALVEYNKSIDEDTGELDTSLFEDDEFTEVFRRLEVKLKVTRVANDPDHPGRPIIGFVGEMIAPSNSAMYGCVQLMADNHLKWRFYSGEMGGGPIWSSVGIQVGGVGSSFGVLGSWTTVFHDADDPVGPFWMQKRPPSRRS